MEIEHIGDNKIRCALTEQEIQNLGFDIDEIIANSEITQEFMRAVLDLIEQQEHIRIDAISPMVKAELMQDHSMAITFGEEKEVTFKDLVDTVSHIMSQLEPGRIEELKKNREEKSASANKKKQKPERMICALRFATLEHMRKMCHVCFPGKVPRSSLYKFEGEYYLILDFTGFTKEEMRPFAFGTVEYDDEHYSDMGQIAHIREYGNCIMKKQAIEMLIQL